MSSSEIFAPDFSELATIHAATAQMQILGLLEPIGQGGNMPRDVIDEADPTRLVYLQGEPTPLHELVTSSSRTADIVRAQPIDTGITVPKHEVQKLGPLSAMRRKIVAKFAVATFGVGGALLASTNVAHANDTEAIQPEAPKPAGSTTTLNVEPNKILVGNLTTIAPGPSGGWSAMYGEAYGGTSVTNPKGNNHISSNAFFADTGTGKITNLVGVAPQDVIVDSKLVLPKTSDIELYANPLRTIDTRVPNNGIGFRAKDTLEIDYGLSRAGQAAIMNIVVDRSNGPAWYAAFPCNEGYSGTSSANTDGIGATPSTNLVKIDSQGKVCIIGSAQAAGIIVDTFGFAKWAIHAPERIYEPRPENKLLLANQELVIQTGMPNGLFIGRLAVDGVNIPGWCSAYPQDKGYQGDSLVNPDGKSATSGLLMIPTDDDGEFGIKCNVDGFPIIDESGLIPLINLGIDPATLAPPKRLYDSRQRTPLVMMSTQGKYAIKQEQIESVTCTASDKNILGTVGNTYDRRINLTVTGIRPDTLPAYDQFNGGSASFNFSDSNEGQTIYSSTSPADQYGVARPMGRSVIGDAYADKPTRLQHASVAKGILTVEYYIDDPLLPFADRSSVSKFLVNITCGLE